MLTNSYDSKPRARAQWPSLGWKPALGYVLLGLALLALIAVSFARPIDRSGESQLDDAFTRALIGFGIARTLNGVISVAQGTEFAVQPAGIGSISPPVRSSIRSTIWSSVSAG